MPEEKNQTEQGISRRQLLKAIAATSGIVAASALLPEKWSSPELEVGVLPAHAQISEILPVTIVSCSMANIIDEVTLIYTNSTIELSCVIRTERSDIEEIPMVVTLSTTPTEDGTQTEVETLTGTPTVLPSNLPNEATFQTTVDLTPYEIPGGYWLFADWTFQNPDDSTDACGRQSEIVELPN